MMTPSCRLRHDDVFSSDDLAQLGGLWQTRLGLDNWRIRWVLHRAPADARDPLEDLSSQLNVSRTDFDRTARIAVIRILHPDDAHRVLLYDLDFEIVHELLHLRFAGVVDFRGCAVSGCSSSNYCPACRDRIESLERAINALAGLWCQGATPCEIRCGDRTCRSDQPETTHRRVVDIQTGADRRRSA